MEVQNVNDLILLNARAFLGKQNDDGSFPAGHNGPYFDDELPVRNTSHILILLLKAYIVSGEDSFLAAARRAAEYVSDDARRPMGANFWARKNPLRDFSNGLIGPAWVIEALMYAAPHFPDLKLAELAEEVFLLHPFDEKEAVWQCVNVDGSYAPVDPTFNHQLWFAAAGSMIEGCAQIASQVDAFLDSLEDNLRIYENGLIIHMLKLRRRLKPKIKDSLRFLLGRSCQNATINKAIAYHAFNTHGFSLLYRHSKNHAFWASKKFRKIIGFLESDLFVQGLEIFLRDHEPDGKTLPFSKYGYAYNPVGIEVAFTAQTFPELFHTPVSDLAPVWLERQFEKTLNRETGLMERNTDDKITLAARINELARVDNFPLKPASTQGK
jgi:hypothetical protein